jgi:hypothetical protein
MFGSFGTAGNLAVRRFLNAFIDGHVSILERSGAAIFVFAEGPERRSNGHSHGGPFW